MTRQKHEAEVIANLQEIITLYDMSTVRDYRTDGREIWIDSAARDACEYAVKVMAENSAEPDKKLLMQALKMCEEKLQEYMHEAEYKEFATTVAKMMFFAEVTASENDEFKRTVFEHWNEITAAVDTETWNSTHGRFTAPAGTFKRIYDDLKEGGDDDEDDI